MLEKSKKQFNITTVFILLLYIISNHNNYVYSNTLTNNRVLYIDESGKLNTTNVTAEELNNKQDKIIAGTGISMIDNTISVDLNSLKQQLLDMIYPIGSIYITIGNTNPSSTLGGTWNQIGEGYALWTATAGAGETINAGLPNITGNYRASDWFRDISSVATEGAFFNDTSKGLRSATGVNGYSSSQTIGFDASRSNSIYGKSSTVQPPAYKVYAWRRTN